jgi:hypothetical protein
MSSGAGSVGQDFKIKADFKIEDRVVYIGPRKDYGEFHKTPGQGQAGKIIDFHPARASYRVAFDGNFDSSSGTDYSALVLQKNLAKEQSRKAIEFVAKVRQKRLQDVEAQNKYLLGKKETAEKYRQDYDAWRQKGKRGPGPKLPTGLSARAVRRVLNAKLLDAQDPIDKSKEREKKRPQRKRHKSL